MEIIYYHHHMPTPKRSRVLPKTQLQLSNCPTSCTQQHRRVARKYLGFLYLRNISIYSSQEQYILPVGAQERNTDT
eukprot:scaffold9511_cov182-Skeletonema_dohrnii-CCMP3373.AAC.21